MNEERMWKASLIGGVVLGVLSSLPLVSCLCCAWAIGGGVLAAYLYVKGSRLPVTLGRGVSLGLLTGFIGALVMGLFLIPIQILASSGGGLAEQFRESINQLPNVPPETRRLVEELVSMNPGIIYAFAGIFTLLFYSLLGMVGGAIGVALFEKRKPGDGEASTYQPPDGIVPPPPPTD